MRGKVMRDEKVAFYERITPAYAGKRCLSWTTKTHPKDHPRLCGEKDSEKFCCFRHRGSPPPMRGKADLIPCDIVFYRITPAYAGKSSCHKKEARGSRDHPRLCGEKPRTLQNLRWMAGSPPPMRGKVIKIADFYGVSRITPAYAGKSLTGTVWTRPPRDHPRLCGEKFTV